jgi:hypothetical protein
LDYLEIEGGYRVYRDGTIVGKRLRKPMKTFAHGNGRYPAVDLYVGGRRRTVFVHRLVAEAFVPNPLGLSEVNHINEDKQDSRADNLEWCDRRHNVRHSFAKRVARSDGKVYESAADVKHDGFEQGSVSRCCRGERRTYRGYRWAYV